MKSINFDEGYKEYAVNGDESRVIRIRITDMNLLKRAKTVLSEIDALKAKYKGTPDSEQLIEFDREVREMINKAFASDICTPAFGEANVATITGDGKMLLVAFFEAFMPILEADINAAAMTVKVNQPEVRPEVQKYTAKAPTIAPVDRKPIAGLANPYAASLPDVSGLSAEQKKALLAQLIA